MLNNGLGEYFMTSTSKIKLVKAMKQAAHNDYKNYLDCCEDIGDKPELNLADFLSGLEAFYCEEVPENEELSNDNICVEFTFNRVDYGTYYGNV